MKIYLSLSGSFVGRRDLHDTVGVDLEDYLDLGYTTRSGRNSRKVEFTYFVKNPSVLIPPILSRDGIQRRTEKIVITGHSSFSLEYLNRNDRLSIGGSRESLLLLRGDMRVSVDDLGENSTGGLDTY